MTTHFSLRVSPSSHTEMIISVSKKVAKKAVVRNLIKRRVRAVMRGFLPDLKPASYLLIALSGAQEVKGQALREELAQLFKKR
jgi:ribonuclease P protein component